MSPLRIVSSSTRLLLLLSSQETTSFHNIVILSHLLREITLLDFLTSNPPQAQAFLSYRISSDGELRCLCVKPEQMKVLKGIKTSVALPTGYKKGLAFRVCHLYMTNSYPNVNLSLLFSTHFFYERSSKIIIFFC